MKGSAKQTITELFLAVVIIVSFLAIIYFY